MRYAVTDQIRRSSMLSRCVLPVLYDLLEISDRQKGVDLTGWHVEDCVLWGKSVQTLSVSRISSCRD